MPLNPRLVKESFAGLENAGPTATRYFYGRLFAEDPRLRGLFPAALDVQRDRLLSALTRVVWSLDNTTELDDYLERLGRDHRRFGVTAEHYPAFGRALTATVRTFCEGEWSAELRGAWETAYDLVSSAMVRAAERTPDDTPPWWVGEVITHALAAPDIATLTVRPATPVPYEAGQHLPVQSPRWPRTWRHYSPAGAPRRDGLLRLHVRAVPGGWVSGALVRHTTVGDTLLLGAPTGGMTYDQTGRDLLLIAGGTGLAPLKAIVERAIALGHRRPIYLFCCVRHSRDLYDTPDLVRLERLHPWLRVVPVVADEPGFDGLHGLAPDVVPRFRDWSDHDIYVCGPDAMVDETVTALIHADVPPDQIHHDQLLSGAA
ncbi:MAG TPA: globin domain-containing protein [Streptosporangiaceae bacterium]